MAITFPRTLPAAPGIKSNTFALVFNIDEFVSPISRQSTFDKRQGHRWEGLFVFPPMLEGTAREWKAWFASMEGQTKTFFAFDPDIRTPLGIADTGSDTPLVKGASQTGTSVTTDAWRNSGTNLLSPGDHVQIGTELKIVTEQVDSDGAGNATINFEPAFHVPPADNAAIVFENPKGIFRLDEPSVPWESDEFGVHNFSFAFVEDF